MGRNGEKELQRIVERIGGYLDTAAADPTRGLSYEAIELATGVSRGHLSRRLEPEIKALVARIAEIRDARRTSRANGAPPTRTTDEEVAGVLDDEALAKLLERQLREIARMQQQWVSRHGAAEAHDGPLALHDLDELTFALKAAAERTRAAVREWNRRHGIETATAGSAPGSSAAQAELPV